MDKRKILVTTTTFPRWESDSTPLFVFELARRLASTYDVTVMAPHYDGAKKRERMGEVTVVRYQYFWPASLQKLCYRGGIQPNLKRNKLLYIQVPLLFLFQLLATVRLVRRERIHLIHAHWIVPQGFLAALASKITDIPFVVTIHGDDILQARSIIGRSLIQYCLSRCSECTVNSTATGQLTGHASTRALISTIPMGVSVETFNPLKRSMSLRASLHITGPWLLFVGRLAEKKGVRYLIEAMPRILEKYSDAVLVVIGDGVLKDQLYDAVNALHIKKSVKFIGSLPNSQLPPYFATADVFIGPSTSDGLEGLGVVFLEALASGVNVVASDVGGISDIITNGMTGMLVPEKQPRAIADAVIELLNNAPLRHTLKQNGLERVYRQFSWDSVTSRFIEVFQKYI